MCSSRPFLSDNWSKEYDSWNQRDLSDEEYVYVWADGIHFNIRLEENKQCILVVMGATLDGKKELIAIKDGVRESEQSWHEIFVELRHPSSPWGTEPWDSGLR